MQELAINDELGNKAAHFFKSGNVLRSRANDKLLELKALLPVTGPNGSKVEYDIWYNFAHDRRVHGYVYTDMLAQFLYLRVASCHFSRTAMKHAAACGITEQGEALFDLIGMESTDKYRLGPARDLADFVIFLPGTNILNTVVNWDRVENALRQGARLKCHPLTSAPAYEHLKHKYGAAIIDKKTSGHQLLAQATRVGFCYNSEMGLTALAQGKEVHHFTNESEWCTYSAIYEAITEKGVLNPDLFKSVLSCKQSGLVPIHVSNPQDYVKGFFNRYKTEPHVGKHNIGSGIKLANRPNRK